MYARTEWMHRARHALIAVVALTLSAAAPTMTPAITTYGDAQPMGDGSVRSYITVDPRNPRVPTELGVAITPAAMEGLPMPQSTSAGHAAHGAPATPAAPHSGHEVLDSHTLLLDLPRQNATPYTFVQLDWNPGGHEPPGVYDIPHFDFHFWTASKAVREQIVPGHPEFDARASRIPPREFWMPQYVDGATAANVPAPLANVPLMGLHWMDVRTPELQGLMGAPEKAQPFTKTFIYGSWDGRFVFAEPMITRAYILAKRSATDPLVRDERIAISVPARVQTPGYYPTAYRIAWDEAEQVYRVALTDFRWID